MTVQGRIQIDGVAGRSMNTLLTGYDFRGPGDCGTTFRLRRSLKLWAPLAHAGQLMFTSPCRRNAFLFRGTWNRVDGQLAVLLLVW